MHIGCVGRMTLCHILQISFIIFCQRCEGAAKTRVRVRFKILCKGRIALRARGGQLRDDIITSGVAKKVSLGHARAY